MSLKSEKLFDAMATFLKESGAESVKKVKAVFKFDISEKKVITSTFIRILSYKIFLYDFII